MELERKVKELLEKKDFVGVHQLLEHQNPADLSLIFEELEKEDIIVAFRLLPKNLAVDTFAYMDSDLQEKLINVFTDKELKEVVDELFLDDTVDLIEEMPANIVKRILRTISPKDRKIVNEFLNYPSDSAGSIMTNEFIDLKENMSVADSFSRIRKIGVDKETIYTCYVLDLNRKIKGIITVKDLLLSEQTTKIRDIMETNVIAIHTLDDKEDAAKMFDKYDLMAIPVLDMEDRLVGIITIDDAIDVLQEETTEDFEIMAAMTPSEDTYFKTSVFTHAKNRIVWLLVLMLTSIITGGVITHYEEAFSSLPLLVAFIPMVMGTGGNCGSQASTLIIRGMSLGEIKLKDAFKAIFKEIRVALVVGIILFLVNLIRIEFQYHDFQLALVVGCTLMCTIALAKVLGCVLPMIAKKLKLDPAIMAAPLISTILDTCSVLIYFNIAVVIMGLG